MRLNCVGALALAMAVAGTTPAAGSDQLPELGELAAGYTYYNRPGATLEQHNHELADCAQWTVLWETKTRVQPARGTMEALGDSLVFHLIWDGTIGGFKAARIENCMVVRGWRVVDIGVAEGRPLSTAPVEVLAAALAQEIGADSPSGTIVRKWANEALRPGKFTIANTSRPVGKQQLSLRLYAESSPQQVTPVFFPDPPVIDPVWPKAGLQPGDIDKAPPGSAIILVRMINWNMGFERMGEDVDDQPAMRDHAPDLVKTMLWRWSAKKEGNWFALAVPPGRWRIAAYCMGSPAFEVAANEIVYAGTFRPEPDLVPDLSMEPALTWLGPNLARRARPAVYQNGARGQCHRLESFLYALEFPGAPFEPGYDWGGARLLGEAAE